MDGSQIDAQIRKVVRDELQKAQPQPLTTPLHIDTIHALKTGGFLTLGSATLASGTVTVEDRRIRTTSTALVTYKTHSNEGSLLALCADGSVAITSNDGTDASEVQYLIIF